MRGASVLFDKIADIALSRGEAPLSKFENCWEYGDRDTGWFIAVNGHKKPKPCSVEGVTIDPFHAYIQWNGFPAGLITPFGGQVAAGGVANEDALIKWIDGQVNDAT